MRRPRPPRSRTGPLLLALAVLPLCGCVQPIDNLRNLEAIHTDQGYAAEVPHRGLWWRTKRGLTSIFGQGNPEASLSEVEDPVGFCLENLAGLREDQDELDGRDRAVAVSLLCDWSRTDPARVVQAACLDSARELLAGPGLLRTPTATVDPEEWEPLLQALRPLVEAEPGTLEALFQQQGEALAATARRLQTIAPREPELGAQVVRYLVVAARQAEDYALGDVLAASASQAASEVAFQTAATRLSDDSEYVQSAAIRLLLALDLPTGTTLLAREYPVFPSARVDLLRTLARADCTIADLDPLLRRQLHRELVSPDADASVRFWARQGIARLLELSPGTPVPELASRWESLIEGPLPAEGP